MKSTTSRGEKKKKDAVVDTDEMEKEGKLFCHKLNFTTTTFHLQFSISSVYTDKEDMVWMAGLYNFFSIGLFTGNLPCLICIVMVPKNAVL